MTITASVATWRRAAERSGYTHVETAAGRVALASWRPYGRPDHEHLLTAEAPAPSWRDGEPVRLFDALPRGTGAGMVGVGSWRIVRES
jgi:hypothetical protein